MSRLFPRPDYAEDQPYGRTILTLHVLSRGFAIGAGVGATPYLARRLFRRGIPSPSHLLRSAGSGALVGTGLLALALLGRMRGRDEIEWKDRSWRLLHNRGQAEVDDWWGVGAVVGGGAAAAVVAGAGRREVRAVAVGGGARGVLGGMGLGALAGMLGHVAWRYGIKGGFEEEKVV